MNDSITIQKALQLLQEDGLLVEYAGPQDLLQKPFTHLSYSSADVQPDTFFICKGLNFKEQYLLDAAAKGAGVYLSAKKYAAEIPCILVSDIRKAMSLVAIAFYGEAYKNFRLIGLTGTKGKTTTTYFMKHILDACCRSHPGAARPKKRGALHRRGGHRRRAARGAPDNPRVPGPAAVLCADPGQRPALFDDGGFLPGVQAGPGVWGRF